MKGKAWKAGTHQNQKRREYGSGRALLHLASVLVTGLAGWQTKIVSLAIKKKINIQPSVSVFLFFVI